MHHFFLAVYKFSVNLGGGFFVHVTLQSRSFTFIHFKPLEDGFNSAYDCKCSYFFCGNMYILIAI